MTITKSRGLNKVEFEALKVAAKAELGSFVSLRRHTQKYCMGAVDISARGHRAEFTPEQFEKVREFIVRHNLTTGAQMYQDMLLSDFGRSSFLTGVNYLWQAVAVVTV